MSVELLLAISLMACGVIVLLVIARQLASMPDPSEEPDFEAQTRTRLDGLSENLETLQQAVQNLTQNLSESQQAVFGQIKSQSASVSAQLESQSSSVREQTEQRMAQMEAKVNELTVHLKQSVPQFETFTRETVDQLLKEHQQPTLQANEVQQIVELVVTEKVVPPFTDRIEEERQLTEKQLSTLQDQMVEKLQEDAKKWESLPADLQEIVSHELALSQDNRLAVVIDFENFLLSLTEKHLEVASIEGFVQWLTHPDVGDGRQRRWVERSLVIHVNRTRLFDYGKYWHRNHSITREQARRLLGEFEQHNFRVVHSQGNVDVPLAMESLELIAHGRIDCLVLVANDNTYAALVDRVAQRGTQVIGVNVGGGMGRDLEAAYSRCGFPKMNLVASKATDGFLARVSTEKSGSDKQSSKKKEKAPKATADVKSNSEANGGVSEGSNSAPGPVEPEA